MNRIMVCLFVLFLLIGISAIPLKAQEVYTGNITINSDGSISPFGMDIPPNSPIQKLDNSTYVFVENIIGNVTVLKDNTVLNGNGYNIEDNSVYWIGQILGDTSGVILQASNVTVKNLQFNPCFTGIHIINSTNCNISMNQFHNCTFGVTLDSANNTTINQNNFTADLAIYTPWVLHEGINIESSENNNITQNSFYLLNYDIWVQFARQNSISNNTSLYGTFLELVDSSNNIAADNNCTYPFIAFSLRNKSTNELTTNNTIVRNTVVNSSFNVVLNNASGNLFFHNNFFNSFQNIDMLYPNSTVESWDNGVEGNYWTDYNGTDINQDGIGDTPYTLHTNDPALLNMSYPNNVDHYPLMKPYPSLFGDVNNDGVVNMKDVMLAIQAFNSFPGSLHWNSFADINGNGRVDMRDILLIVLNFGKHL